MRKRRFIFLAAASVLLLVALFWWATPVTFLKGVPADKVTSIEVFDGGTGIGFTVVAPEDIQYIVSNLQQASMQREKLSLGYMGTRFRLTFYDDSGVPLETLIVNSANTIRKDPFFYRDPDASLCLDYLDYLVSLES